MRWSRNLPAAPSSVTITLDRAGRYHASFVVEAVAAPLAPAETAVGIDLGLTSFAALSDGRKVDNPRWLRQRERGTAHPQLLTELLDRPSVSDAPSAVPPPVALATPLTDQEQAVLDFLDSDLTTRQIASRLGLSERTIESHIAKLYSKLGARTRVQAVVEASRLGLLE